MNLKILLYSVLFTLVVVPTMGVALIVLAATGSSGEDLPPCDRPIVGQVQHCDSSPQPSKYKHGHHCHHHHGRHHCHRHHRK